MMTFDRHGGTDRRLGAEPEQATPLDRAAIERDRMVDKQIAARGVSDARVLDVMRRVPREAFVVKGFEEFAYEDSPLPIEEGQTISQPYIVALMIEAAEVKPGDRVLEIGTGSGYAAAVLSRIAAKVHTIERHRALAEGARRRFGRLGYRNVDVRHGDGTLGWPEAAPFDAIIVTAGGPEVIPETFREQLKIGGRLVIPIGTLAREQRLIKVVRDGESEFHEADLGAVTFVPLIGSHGWSEAVGAASQVRPETRAPAARPRWPADVLREAAEPLPDLDDPAFGRVVDRFADARIVLLGAATHGTSEFYRARAAITRRLVEQHSFTIVAAEADWPDAAAIDRYARHETGDIAERAIHRFPNWIWRNAEVHGFVDWLRAYNEPLDPKRRTGFFGLDIYAMDASIRAVIDCLDKADPEAARIARERYGCLTPWQKDPATYGRAVLGAGFARCEAQVVAMLRDLHGKRMEHAHRDGESFFDAARNAGLVAAAERHYRTMYYGAAEAWNLRDRHMFETLAELLAFHGANSKAVVWAHNCHVGDAAATELGQVRGALNIGQLCRERFGSAAALIGFGTDRGTVAAASQWDGPMEVKRLRSAHRDSYERLCRDIGIDRFLVDLRDGRAPELRRALGEPRLERAIGVIYRPETELASHYFDASLPQQFDAYLWFAETRAVTPLPAERPRGAAET